MHKITLIIPTYERSDYLFRVLHYLLRVLDLKLIKIMVLDGSNESAFRNKKICSELSVVYKHFDPSISLEKRIALGLETVVTDYVLLHPDDDLINPLGLYTSLTFLEKNQEFVTAHGQYVGFSISDKLEVTFKEIYLLPYYPICRSIQQENPVERLLDFMSHFMPLHYALHRTTIFKQVWQKVFTYLSDVDEDHLFPELMFSGLLSWVGKIKQLKIFYMAKELGQSLPRNARLPEHYLIHENFYYKYSKYQEGMLKEVDELGAAWSESYKKSIVDLTFLSYCWIRTSPLIAEHRLFGKSLKEDRRKRFASSIEKYLRKYKALYLLLRFVNYDLKIKRSAKNKVPVGYLLEYYSNIKQTREKNYKLAEI